MDKILSYIIILLSSSILLLFSTNSIGQNVSSYSFNDLYDFDIKTVYDIKQDDQGNFWFGTDRGIVNFDGKNFQTFFYPKFDKEYTNIKFGPDGAVYFINFGGQLFRLKNDSIEIVIEYVLEDSFIKDYFFVGNDIYYFVSKGQRIYKHSNSKKVDEVIVEIEGRSNFEGLSMKGDKLIAYKLFTQNKEEKLCGIAEYKIETSPGNKADISNLINFPQKSSVNHIIDVGDKNLYMQFSSHLNIYDLVLGSERIISNIEIKGSTINSVSYQKGKAYILGKTQIIELNLKSKKYNLWMDDVNSSCMFIDNEKNTWIGTLNDGIKIVPTKKVIQLNLTDFDIGVSEMDIHKNIFFSDSRGSIYKTSPPYEKSTKIQTTVIPRQRMSINNYGGKVYFASHDEYFDLQKDKLVRKKGNDFFKSLFFLDAQNYIRTGGDNNYLFGELRKLPFRFPELTVSGKDGSFEIYLLKSGRADQVFVDKNRDFMYLDFIDGLILFSRDKDPISLYLNGEPILVSDMQPDDFGGMYVATNNNELIYFKDGVYQTHIELSEQIDKICLAKEYVFLKGNKGIYRYNFKSKKTDLINFIDGVKAEDVVDMYFHSDTLYTIGGKGICKFPYNYAETNTIAPYLTLKDVELFDKSVASGKTVFEYNENQITFKFQAVGIRSQKTLIYKYQLNNQEWQQTSWSVPFVRYAQLAPGEYEFSVMACNEDGLCSDPLFYQFIIKEHYTDTWWFKSVLGISLLLILFFVIYFRLARIKKENSLLHQQEELKREVYKSKITAIRSQMNPHFMFNALNTIQDYIISNEKLIASEFLADFADLMRMYLNQSKQDFITIDEEIRTIDLYLKLEKSRFGDDFEYEIVVDQNVDVGNIEIPIMLLQPLIENAIKHGLLHKKGLKELKIILGFVNNRLKLEVIDNGIGFEKSIQMKSHNSSHDSFATNAMQEKITLLKLHYQIEIDFQIQHLKDENGNVIGTSITLLI